GGEGASAAYGRHLATARGGPRAIRVLVGATGRAGGPAPRARAGTTLALGVVAVGARRDRRRGGRGAKPVVRSHSVRCAVRRAARPGGIDQRFTDDDRGDAEPRSDDAAGSSAGDFQREPEAIGCSSAKIALSGQGSAVSSLADR